MSCLPESYLPLTKARRGIALRKILYVLIASFSLSLLMWDICVLWELSFRPGTWWRLSTFWGLAILLPVGLLTSSLRRAISESHLRNAARLLQKENPRLGHRLECALDIIPLNGSSEFITAALKQTGRDLALVDTSAAVSRILNRKRLALFSLLLLLCLTFPAIMPKVYFNALQRLVYPFRETEAIGSVYISAITPGDSQCLYGDDLTISAKIQNQTNNEKPLLLVDDKNGPTQSKALQTSATGLYSYTLRKLERTLRYRIICGNSASQWHTLTVLPPPSVKSAGLLVTPPAYTAQKMFRINLDKRKVFAPEDSRVTFIATTDRPVKSAFLSLPGGGLCPLDYKNGHISGSFNATHQGVCTLTLQEEGGRAIPDALSFTINLQTDSMVSLRMIQPDKNIQCAPGAEVFIKAQARDDYGVKSLTLYFRRNTDGQPQKIPAVMVADKKQRQASIEYRFVFQPSLYLPGDQITLWAEATDNAPEKNRLAQSRKISVTIINARKQRQKQVQGINRLMTLLAKTLQTQKVTHRDTARAASLSGEAFRTECERLKKLQQQVSNELLNAANTISSLSDPFSTKATEVLQSLKAAESSIAIASLTSAAAVRDNEKERKQQLAKAIKPQAMIIFRLQQILGIAGEALAQANDPLGKDGDDMSNPLLQKLQKAKDELDKFVAAQRKVAETAEELSKKDVDDFTDEDKKNLDELKATEENWANFLRELQSDLSKLPPQDFSNPSMLGEVAAVLEEVEMVESSLTAKEVEISTTAAQAGVELAESMQNHLEKWLQDEADHRAWKMEEPLEDYEIPMAELPEKLEDIIGELVEQEEDLMEEAEDQSSSWADSLDEGAGWDAADGPMSNYSAQGVTGNQLPNSTEVGGRSGEGRQGKSHGEMVGDTAVGKGGRKTPSRLTPDAYEEGQINDQSKESSGGATGGGKGGNAGAEGLEGPAPAEQEENMPRLLGKQAELRNRAERIRLQLKLKGHNTTLIDKTLNELRTAESELKSGRYGEGSRITRQAVNNLRQYGKNLTENSSLQTDHAATLPKDLEREMLQGVSDGLPSGYEDMVRGYYDRLATSVSE